MAEGKPCREKLRFLLRGKPKFYYGAYHPTPLFIYAVISVKQAFTDVKRCPNVTLYCTVFANVIAKRVGRDCVLVMSFIYSSMPTCTSGL